MIATMGGRRRATVRGIRAASMTTTKLSLPPATAPTIIAVTNRMPRESHDPGVLVWYARIAAATTASGTHSPATARYWL